MISTLDSPPCATFGQDYKELNKQKCMNKQVNIQQNIYPILTFVLAIKRFMD